MTGVLVEASLRRVLLLSWLVPAWLVAVVATSATPALAAGPCGSSGVLSQSGSTATEEKRSDRCPVHTFRSGRASPASAGGIR